MSELTVMKDKSSRQGLLLLRGVQGQVSRRLEVCSLFSKVYSSPPGYFFKKGNEMGLEIEQGGNLTHRDHSGGPGWENSPLHGKNKHLKWREKPGLNKKSEKPVPI